MTTASLNLLYELAKDAGNWSDQPLLNGNVATSKALRGNLTQLKVEGLIQTEANEGHTWVLFTAKGAAYAKDNWGITIQTLATE